MDKHDPCNKGKVMDEESLNTAINLVRSGQRLAARNLLARLLRDDPSDETAWLWLAETMENDPQRAAALKQCLSVNPGSEVARNALKQLKVPTDSPSQKAGLMDSPPPILPPVLEPPASGSPPVQPSISSKQKPIRPGFIRRLLKGCLVVFAILLFLGLISAGVYYLYRYLSMQPAPTPTAIPITVAVPTETRATRFVLQPTAIATLIPSPTSQPTPTYRPAPNFDPAWKIAWLTKDAGLYTLSSVGIPKLEISPYPYSSYPPPGSRLTVSGQSAWLYPPDGSPRKVLVNESAWASATEGWNATMSRAMLLPARSAVILEAVEAVEEENPRLLGFVVVSETNGQVLFTLQMDPVQGRAFYSPDGRYAVILTPSALSLVDFTSGEIHPNLIVLGGGTGQSGAASNPGRVYWLGDGTTFYVAIPQSNIVNGHQLYMVEATTASAYRLKDLPTSWDTGPLYFLEDGSALLMKDSEGALFLFDPQDAWQTPIAGIGDVISSAADGRHFLLWTGKEYWVSLLDGEPYRLGMPGMQLEKPVWLGNLDLVFLVKEDTMYSLYYQGMNNPPQRLVAGLGTDLDEIGLFTWPEGEAIPWKAPDSLPTPGPALSMSTQANGNTAVPGLTTTPGPGSTPELQSIPGLTLQAVLNSLWKKGFNCSSAAGASNSDPLEYDCSLYEKQEFDVTVQIIPLQGGITSIHEIILNDASADQAIDEAAIPIALDQFSFLALLPFQGADPDAAKEWLENNIPSVIKNGGSVDREFSPVQLRLSRPGALVFDMSTFASNE
jgi:hypothetical protein